MIPFLLHIIASLIYRLSYSQKVFFSDTLAWFLRNIIRYRRKIVSENISSAFPEMKPEDVNTTAKKFYTHLADRITETLFATMLTEKEVTEICTIENYELVENLLKRGKNVIATLAHCGSWEIACLRAGIQLNGVVKNYAVYTHINNTSLNNYVKQTRGRFGMELYNMQEIATFLKKGLGEQSVGMYLADQNHSNPSRAYWTNFLNRDTPFMTGPARFAKAWDAAMIYVEVINKGRFKYAIRLSLIAEDTAEKSVESLTEDYIRKVETQIRNMPADWLWSHKRWKHKREYVA